MGSIRWGVLALLAASANWAATLPYQGLATDIKGNPMADKAYGVGFALYPAASGGAAVWTENQNLTTRKGLFSTSLGLVAEIPDSLFKGPALYLGVAFDGGAEGGRVRLGTTPWARKADTANFALAADRANSVPGMLDSLASLRFANAGLVAKAQADSLAILTLLRANLHDTANLLRAGISTSSQASSLKARGDSASAAKALIDSSKALRDTIATLRSSVTSMLAFLAPAVASPWKSTINFGGMVDARDGQFYRTVVMGTQTWMAQNLNYAGKSNSIGVCANNLQANCDKFARQYSFAQAMALPDSCNSVACVSLMAARHQGACPTSWHVPTEVEWDTLARFVDPQANLSLTYGLVSTPAGPALKSTADWTTANGTDSYGFRALPAGGYGSAPGSAVAWWVGTEFAANYGFRWEIRSSNDLARYSVTKTSGSNPALLPVRCMKD